MEDRGKLTVKIDMNQSTRQLLESIMPWEVHRQMNHKWFDSFVLL